MGLRTSNLLPSLLWCRAASTIRSAAAKLKEHGLLHLTLRFGDTRKLNLVKIDTIDGGFAVGDQASAHISQPPRQEVLCLLIPRQVQHPRHTDEDVNHIALSGLRPMRSQPLHGEESWTQTSNGANQRSVGFLICIIALGNDYHPERRFLHAFCVNLFCQTA